MAVGLTVPSEKLSIFIAQLESIFIHSKQLGLSILGVKGNLLKNMGAQNLKLSDCQKCKCEESIINIFCTLRLKHTLKIQNQKFSSTPLKKKSKSAKKLARITSV